MSDYLRLLTMEGRPDREIDAEDPFEVVIGPEKRVLRVRALPYDAWVEFHKLYGLFLVAHYNQLQMYQWPEWKEYKADKSIRRFAAILETVAQEKTMRDFTMLIIRKSLFADLINRPIPWQIPSPIRKARTGYWTARARARKEEGWEMPEKQGMTFRYFRRHVTIDQMIKIFLAIYLFNCEAVKKNVGLLAKKIGVDTAQWLYSSMRDLAGISGRSVRPRYQGYFSLFNGGSKQTPKTSPKGKEEKPRGKNDP